MYVSRFLDLVILGSSCLKEPDAEFRGYDYWGVSGLHDAPPGACSDPTFEEDQVL